MHCVDLGVSSSLEHRDDFFPTGTVVEVFEDRTVFLLPSMLFRSIKECVIGFPDVGFRAPRASIFIDYPRVAEERNSVFVGGEE